MEQPFTVVVKSMVSKQPGKQMAADERLRATLCEQTSLLGASRDDRPSNF